MICTPNNTRELKLENVPGLALGYDGVKTRSMSWKLGPIIRNLIYLVEILMYE